MTIKWESWRGSLDGQVTFVDKTLLAFRGWKVTLHKFIGADDPGCFHTHPAWALRVVLWGGYVEEVPNGFFRRFWPGRVGLVPPWFAHRVSELMRGPSYSLWIRGPKVAAIQLHGDGWPAPSDNEREEKP